MATVQTTNYVVTGANRGLGLGLVGLILARPNTTVIGTVRSSQARDQLAEAAKSLPKGDGSALYIATVDYSAVPDADTIRKSFAEATGGAVKHIDVLICNAGFTDDLSPVLETTAAQMREHFDVNSIGPLVTFQALYPYMKKEARPNTATPAKAILISSFVGSIGLMEPLPGGAYGPSKAAANWIAKAIHVEHSKEGIASVSVHPGFIPTSMGQKACESWKLPVEAAADSVEDCVRGLLGLVDAVTLEGHSGKFLTRKGEELGW